MLFPALVAGLAWEIWDAVHRRFGRARPEALWLVSVLAAYALLLPIGHRFDRYLVPVLPAAAILAVGTLQRLALVAGRATGWLRHTAPAIPVALACAALLHVAAPVDAVQSYTTWCRYHWVRHERAGRWLAAHTPANAVVATHDIGAIGYYSQREIVDIAGLVSPDVVAHVRQPDFTAYLADLFARRHVTHVAMLREWMQVSNVAPLFVADPEPEILEVYAWIPGVTHLVSREATSAALAAQGLLRAGRIQEALAQARASVQLDSLNADGWTVLGYLEGTANDPAEAFTSLQRALHLRPGDRQTRMGLVRVDIDAGRTEQARALLAALIAESPHDKDALELSDKLPAAPPAAPPATPR